VDRDLYIISTHEGSAAMGQVETSKWANFSESVFRDAETRKGRKYLSDPKYKSQ
jgi:hypothetical protein